MRNRNTRMVFSFAPSVFVCFCWGGFVWVGFFGGEFLFFVFCHSVKSFIDFRDYVESLGSRNDACHAGIHCIFIACVSTLDHE